VTHNIDDIVGIHLINGPGKLRGWKNAYSLSQLGGWPLPDYLAAGVLMDRVVVAIPDNVPADFQDDMVIYRKVEESKLPDIVTGHIMRGASYEAVA